MGAVVAMDTRRAAGVARARSIHGESERMQLHLDRQAAIIRRQEQRIVDLIELAERQRDEIDRLKAR